MYLSCFIFNFTYLQSVYLWLCATITEPSRCVYLGVCATIHWAISLAHLVCAHFCSLREGQLRLTPDPKQSSCLSLLSTGITGWITTSSSANWIFCRRKSYQKKGYKINATPKKLPKVKTHPVVFQFIYLIFWNWGSHYVTLANPELTCLCLPSAGPLIWAAKSHLIMVVIPWIVCYIIYICVYTHIHTYVLYRDFARLLNRFGFHLSLLPTTFSDGIIKCSLVEL